MLKRESLRNNYYYSRSLKCLYIFGGQIINGMMENIPCDRLVFKTHLHAGLKRSVGSYEEYH
jgi:hypothetical protein